MAADGEDRAERFRSGDARAIASVSRLIRYMVGEKGYFVPLDEREDVTQEVLIHLHRAVSAPDFQLTHSFDAFVRRVTHRRCVDWMRRHDPVELSEPEVVSAAPDPERELLASERTRRGVKVLASLGSPCRELIRLRVGQGMRYREIASRLGRTESGVRSQMYKCLRRARQLLENADRGGAGSRSAGSE